MKVHLFRGEQSVEAELSFRSRLMPSVKFFDAPPPAGTEFSKVTWVSGEQTFELSRARFLTGGLKGTHGALLFLDDAYDFEPLFREGRLIKLRGFLDKLPLVLSQKDGVPAAFKEYVADLLYELSVYERFFNEQDRLYSADEPAAAHAAQQALIAAEGPAFRDWFEGTVKRLDALVDGLDKETYERASSYFRRVLWDFILGAEFLKRTNLKPRGYAGDAQMMRMVYEDQHVGIYAFNKLMHRYPISVPAAEAVRGRRKLIAGALLEETQRHPDAPRLRYFSVACGPAWELRDAFADAATARRWEGTLLDQDAEALALAKEGLTELEQRLGTPLEVKWVPDSVRTMLRTRNLDERFGRFHFVYSMGLFDYLTAPVAKAVLARLYGLLEPGGRLVVGNYHQAHPNRHYMAFWLDWVLYLRNEAEMAALTEGLDGAEVQVKFDPTGCQMFLDVRRAR